MSGGAGPDQNLQPMPGTQVVVVAASWHADVMDGLVAGALRVCEQADADVRLVRVPGAFELPIVASAAASDPDVDAVVALGVVIRGGTPHFEYVCQSVTAGITQVALSTGTPIGFGVLTCDNEQQAIDRAGGPGASEDKGAEAAHAALATARVLRGFDARDSALG